MTAEWIADLERELFAAGYWRVRYGFARPDFVADTIHATVHGQIAAWWPTAELDVLRSSYNIPHRPTIQIPHHTRGPGYYIPPDVLEPKTVDGLGTGWPAIWRILEKHGLGGTSNSHQTFVRLTYAQYEELAERVGGRLFLDEGIWFNLESGAGVDDSAFAELAAR